MPKRSTLRLHPKRFGTVPGGKKGRRALAKAYTVMFRAVPSTGRHPRQVRRILTAAGVRFRKGGMKGFN